MAIYHREKIYQGEYLNLYDIANDVPEFHVTRKDNKLYYFAPGPYSGEIELRGLREGTYSIFDLSTNEMLADDVGAEDAHILIHVKNDIYIKAVPKGR